MRSLVISSSETDEHAYNPECQRRLGNIFVNKADISVVALNHFMYLISKTSHKLFGIDNVPHNFCMLGNAFIKSSYQLHVATKMQWHDVIRII